MTTRRFPRRPRRTIRRAFFSQNAVQTSLATDMIDLLVRAELAFDADSEIHELVITGIAIDSISTSIHKMVVFVGRTSTHPSDTDRGVRVRHFAANPTGLPFVFRFKNLRMNPGDQLGVHTQAVVEDDTSSIHQNTIVVKDVFYELP